MKCKIFVQNGKVVVIGDDFPDFGVMGVIINAGRFADVFPRAVDGKVKWFVRLNNEEFGPYDTKQEALAQEERLWRIRYKTILE